MMSIEQEKAKNKGVSLHVEYLNIGNVFNPYLKQYSAKMKSDAGRIQQVILNLQSNALKFTTKGSVKHVVQVTKGLFDEEITEDSPLYLQIQTIDSGQGIKKEQQDKLFKPFGYIDDGKQLNN